MVDALSLQNLYKIYKEGDIETVALRDAHLSVQFGEFVAITGYHRKHAIRLFKVGSTAPGASRICESLGGVVRVRSWR